MHEDECCNLNRYEVWFSCIRTDFSISAVEFCLVLGVCYLLYETNKNHFYHTHMQPYIIQSKWSEKNYSRNPWPVTFDYFYILAKSIKVKISGWIYLFIQKFETILYFLFWLQYDQDIYIYISDKIQGDKINHSY